MKTMQDIRGYLDVAVLDRLASDWALAQEEDSVE
jgi:hypothetical protein